MLQKNKSFLENSIDRDGLCNKKALPFKFGKSF